MKPGIRRTHPRGKPCDPVALPETPADLSHLYSVMRKARRAIFFAVFLPSRLGANSVVQEAIDMAMKDPSPLVCGVVSAPTVLPNYLPRSETGQEPPNTDDEGNIHLVRASALSDKDVMGSFEDELLSAGPALDGIHNLGYKASYEHDENFLTMGGEPPPLRPLPLRGRSGRDAQRREERV